MDSSSIANASVLLAEVFWGLGGRGGQQDNVVGRQCSVSATQQSDAVTQRKDREARMAGWGLVAEKGQRATAEHERWDGEDGDGGEGRSIAHGTHTVVAEFRRGIIETLSLPRGVWAISSGACRIGLAPKAPRRSRCCSVRRRKPHGWWRRQPSRDRDRVRRGDPCPR
jgi:hypothetical protein